MTENPFSPLLPQAGPVDILDGYGVLLPEWERKSLFWTLRSLGLAWDGDDDPELRKALLRVCEYVRERVELELESDLDLPFGVERLPPGDAQGRWRYAFSNDWGASVVALNIPKRGCWQQYDVELEYCGAPLGHPDPVVQDRGAGLSPTRVAEWLMCIQDLE